MLCGVQPDIPSGALVLEPEYELGRVNRIQCEAGVTISAMRLAVSQRSTQRAARNIAPVEISPHLESLNLRVVDVDCLEQQRITNNASSTQRLLVNDEIVEAPAKGCDIEFQAIQFKIADMGTGIAAARLLTYKAAVRKDAGQSIAKEAAKAKLYASEVAEKAANEAVQIFGGYGFIKDYPVEKFYRDVKLLTIGEGTSEVQRIVLARQLLQD